MMDDQIMARREVVAEVWRTYLDRVAEAHDQSPALWGTPVSAIRASLAHAASRPLVAHVERRLAAGGQIRLQASQVALAGHHPLAALSTQARARLQVIEQLFRDGGVTPPDPAALPSPDASDPALVDLLASSGRLISLRNHALRQTLTFHIEALDDALAGLRDAFPHPAEFTTGQARETLQTSRKFIVPVLEHLDARGDSVRRGDVRQLTPG